MHLVKCEKCIRKMLEQTLNYKHQESWPGNNPKQPKPLKVKESKVEVIEDVKDIEDITLAPPPMPPLKRSTTQCSTTARHSKMSRKKEQFKALFANAF